MIVKIPAYFDVKADFTPSELAQFREYFEDQLARFLKDSYGSKGRSGTFFSKKVTVTPMEYMKVKQKLGQEIGKINPNYTSKDYDNFDYPLK